MMGPTPAWIAAGWTMVHLVWVGGAIGAVGAILRRVLRSARPEWRYGAAIACLAALTLAPFALFSREYEPSAAVAEAAPVAAEDAKAATPSRGLPSRDFAGPAPHLTAGATVAPRAEAQTLLESLVPRLPWLWMAGSSATSLLLAAGLAGAVRLRRASRPLEGGNVAALADRLAGSLGVARRFGLGVCDRLASPVLLGVVRPMILLPASALSGWTAEELEMAILHELAHLRRHDNAVNLLQCVAECLLFFHPAAWWLSAWVRLEREHCCDRLVVERTGRSRVYAELLASLAGAGRRGAIVSAMAERPLMARIRKILDLEDRPMRLSMPEGCALIIAGLVAGAIALGAHAGDAPKPPEGKDAEARRAALRGLVEKVAAVPTDKADAGEPALTLMAIAEEQIKAGDRPSARETMRRAERFLGRRAESPSKSLGFNDLIAEVGIAEKWREVGDPDEARAVLDRATKVLDAAMAPGAPEGRIQGGPTMLVEWAHRLAEQRIKLGDLVEARRLLTRAADRFRAVDDEAGPLYLAVLGATLVEAGDAPGGRALVDRGRRGIEVQHPGHRARSRRLIVKWVARSGDLDGAFAILGDQEPEAREETLHSLLEAFLEDDPDDAASSWLDPSGIKILIGARGLKAKRPADGLAKVAARLRALDVDAKVKARSLAVVATALAKVGETKAALEAAELIPPIARGEDAGPSDGFYESVRPATFAAVASAIAKGGDRAGAAAVFERAAKLARDVEPPGERLIAMIALGNAYVDAKDDLSALGVVRESIELAKGLPEPRRSRGLVMLVRIESRAGVPGAGVQLIDSVREYPGAEKAQALSELALKFEKDGDADTARALAKMILECVKVKRPEGFRLGPQIQLNAFGRDTFVDPDLEFSEGHAKFEMERVVERARNLLGDVAEAERAARKLPMAKGAVGGRDVALGMLAYNLARKGRMDEALRIAATVEEPNDRLWAYRQIAAAVRAAGEEK